MQRFEAVAQVIDTLTPGSTLVGDYDIIRVLGSGGFGNTYLAMDRSLNREVAIKEFFPRDIAFREDQTTVSIKNPKFEGNFKWALDRFAQEARLLAKFRHPNIVRVFRTFEANRTSYIVLDYVHGKDLETWLRQLRRRPTQQELDDLLVPLTDALALLHDAQVLHRDIKPANICIRAETGEPVLLDFGASKYSMSEMTGTTAAIVSRGYSPYEAYATDSKQQGAWTDIYGLGATMYRALTNATPPEATERLLNDTMVPLSSQELPGFRSTFLAAVDWALTVQPRSRPQSVAEWQPRLLAGSEAAALTWQARPFPGAAGNADTRLLQGAAGRSSGRYAALFGLVALLLVGGGGGLAFSLGWIPSTLLPQSGEDEARRRAALQQAEDERRQREAKAAADAEEARRQEDARRQRDAKAAADAAEEARQRAAETARRQREAKAAADAEEARVQRERAAEEARRQREAKAAADAEDARVQRERAAEEARRQREAKAATDAEEARVQRERAAEEARRQREAKAAAEEVRGPKPAAKQPQRTTRPNKAPPQSSQPSGVPTIIGN
ncbi:MAG TPA: serine/threonine-protein kinase [Hyphomicrobiaceae bacterium]|nr:serine/threonine-protein kinase [Hyphomicrobiaceae bacterium]